MIQLDNLKLSNGSVTQLNKYHKKVTSKRSFKNKVIEAKRIWESASKSNKTFTEVKEKLAKMCSGSRRCCYCEDAPADEIEHIAPKSIYPLLCFKWENYLYACGLCNGPKNNKFAIFLKTTGLLEEVTPPPKTYLKPPKGESALINPRKENPMDYLMLDIQGGTFRFVIIEKNTASKAYQKAEYTRKILHLNDREYLVKSRQTTFENYCARLEQYIIQKRINATPNHLKKLKEGILSEGHITVFKEMQRQYQMFNLFKNYFDEIPEALKW